MKTAFIYAKMAFTAVAFYILDFASVCLGGTSTAHEMNKLVKKAWKAR